MLSQLILDIENGKLPQADFGVRVVPAPSPTLSAVVSFTGTAVVAADVDEMWVQDRIPTGDLSAPLNPPFLSSLESHLDRRVNNIDMVTLATPRNGTPPIDLTFVDDADHPRVKRAQRYRDDVRVWQAPGGVLILGRGLTGRWEVAVEVDEDSQGNGLGRALAYAARHLVPDTRPVWAQIAPGNAVSVRAFLSVGYQPFGAEALLVPHEPAPRK